MGLERKTEAELKVLGIERKAVEEKDIVNPIDRKASKAEKVRQLRALSAENKPLVKGF